MNLVRDHRTVFSDIYVTESFPFCKLFQFVHRLKKKKKKGKNASRLRPGVRGTFSRGRVSHGVTVLFQNRCRDTASSTGSLLVIRGIWVRPLGSLNNHHFEELIHLPSSSFLLYIRIINRSCKVSSRRINFRNKISITDRDLLSYR